MKPIILSAILILALLVTVILFSFYSTNILTDFYDEVSGYDMENSPYHDIIADFEEIRDEFMKNEPMLRLLISDVSLLEIDALVSDIIEYSRAENREGVLSAAGRLRVSLSHLVSISGFNLVSIF